MTTNNLEDIDILKLLIKLIKNDTMNNESIIDFIEALKPCELQKLKISMPDILYAIKPLPKLNSSTMLTTQLYTKNITAINFYSYNNKSKNTRLFDTISKSSFPKLEVLELQHVNGCAEIIENLFGKGKPKKFYSLHTIDTRGSDIKFESLLDIQDHFLEYNKVVRNSKGHEDNEEVCINILTYVTTPSTAQTTITERVSMSKNKIMCFYDLQQTPTKCFLKIKMYH